MIKDKKILLCVTGGIAAYKSIDLASSLVKSGAIVKTIMTHSALEFITPLSFRSITKHSVSFDLFDTHAPIEHISLSDWADIIVISPATANIIGKIANGIGDDLLTTTVMASTCPKLIIPAMNVNMYENPIVQENMQKLNNAGYMILTPDVGLLACGKEGIGRMPSPVEILYAIKTYLVYGRDLLGKKVLVTAGASRERIDPMRYISNLSSGKTGLSIARAAALRGAEVTVIHSRVHEPLPYYTNNISTYSANDMQNEVLKISENFNIIIMCAAVADFTILEPALQKIKKKEDISITLTQTKDILLELGKRKDSKQFLIGFAAETENIRENARHKMINKNLDMIVANDISVAGLPESHIMIFSKGKQLPAEHSGDKFYLAHVILSEYLNVATS